MFLLVFDEKGCIESNV